MKKNMCIFECFLAKNEGFTKYGNMKIGKFPLTAGPPGRRGAKKGLFRKLKCHFSWLILWFLSKIT